MMEFLTAEQVAALEDGTEIMIKFRKMHFSYPYIIRRINGRLFGAMPGNRDLIVCELENIGMDSRYNRVFLPGTGEAES
jgi:hypothetical protein